MSNKWIIIQLADEFGLQIYENKIFGQLKNSNQLVRIESSPIFSVAFRLSASLNTAKLEHSIQQFNKRKWGRAFIEDNLLLINNIHGTLTNPKKHFNKLCEITNWWNEELSKFQSFEKFSKVALYKNGPDEDKIEVEEINKLQLERDKASTDDRQGIVRGVALSIAYATIVGGIAGILSKYKISIFPLELFIVFGLVSKSFKKEGRSFNFKSLAIISSVFIVAFLIEQFGKLVTYHFLINGHNPESIIKLYFEIIVKNYKWFLSPIVVVALLLLTKFVESRSPNVVRGREIDDIDRSLAELKLKKMRISLYSFLSIILILIPLFLHIIYILHDVVYPNYTTQFILFALLVALCFYGNYSLTTKFIGNSPFKKHERESRFEAFEDNLGRFITSVFMAGTIALTTNVVNVMLDPFQKNTINAILKEDYPLKLRSCVTLTLELHKSHNEDFSFCDEIGNPPKAGSRVPILEGQGLFGMRYYKKIFP